MPRNPYTAATYALLRDKYPHKLRRIARKRWNHMLDRCYNEKCGSYHNYGKRGITVCDRWKDFDLFYADVGDAPRHDVQFDRMNNDGNYTPDNWRWATARQQGRNRRIQGKTRIFADGTPIPHHLAAKLCGRTSKGLEKRLYKLRKRGVTEIEVSALTKETHRVTNHP
jgi:hypothetical protein